MSLKSLTYTSLARLDLDAGELEAIHRTAREMNALEGITGILIFNGTHFLQIIEGARDAIDELLERLRRDPRHSGPRSGRRPGPGPPPPRPPRRARRQGGSVRPRCAAW